MHDDRSLRSRDSIHGGPIFGASAWWQAGKDPARRRLSSPPRGWRGRWPGSSNCFCTGAVGACGFSSDLPSRAKSGPGPRSGPSPARLWIVSWSDRAGCSRSTWSDRAGCYRSISPPMPSVPSMQRWVGETMQDHLRRARSACSRCSPCSRWLDSESSGGQRPASSDVQPRTTTRLPSADPSACVARKRSEPFSRMPVRCVPSSARPMSSGAPSKTPGSVCRLTR